MQGRAFLDLARDLLRGRTEADWRGAVIHAYYAVFLEGRDALVRWTRPLSPRDAHRQVRLTFAYASDGDVQKIGDALDFLSPARAHASYYMNPRNVFLNDGRARGLVQRATDALAVLDAVDADPARRAAAIAALPPPIP